MKICQTCLIFFFFNDTATTEIYTLSLHDALPISVGQSLMFKGDLSRALDHFEQSIKLYNPGVHGSLAYARGIDHEDRKSTRLNSSHLVISYAVFCLKKKNTSRTFLWQDQLIALYF